MVFYSKESKFFTWIVYGFMLISIILPFSIILNNYAKIIPAIFLFIVFVFVTYFLFKIKKNTYYTFETDSLNCKSWILKRNILYSEIDSIETQVTLFTGLKLSLASKGIVIHYKGIKSVFISPENEIEFIHELSKRKETQLN